MRGSVRWYQSLHGLPETVPAHDDFGQIRDAGGTVPLRLHAWSAHGRPSLASLDHAPPASTRRRP